VISWLSKLSLNHKLGGLALVLGVVSIGATVEPRPTTTVHTKELLTRIEREEDHIHPSELATWILEGRTDYRLIDIRSRDAFDAYHIPTAECLPMARVADGELRRTDKIILYGDGGIHAAQAWMVLSGMGYKKVYTLREGLDAWKEDVLFPTLPATPSPAEQARFERTAHVARFFGGQPRVASTATTPGATPVLPATPALPAPTLLAPTLPGGGGAGAPPKKKREGC